MALQPDRGTGGAAPPVPRSVLYIEDNPVNTVLMEAMLARMPGLAVACAASAEAGLALAIAEPPALILADIQMPGMDGFALLRCLREHPATRHVPVIAVSANAMPQDLERGIAAGFADYLTKPLDLAQLLAAVTRALPLSPPPPRP
jgi:CheY-like chemotaxis protein